MALDRLLMFFSHLFTSDFDNTSNRMRSRSLFVRLVLDEMSLSMCRLEAKISYDYRTAFSMALNARSIQEMN